MALTRCAASGAAGPAAWARRRAPPPPRAAATTTRLSRRQPSPWPRARGGPSRDGVGARRGEAAPRPARRRERRRRGSLWSGGMPDLVRRAGRSCHGPRAGRARVFFFFSLGFGRLVRRAGSVAPRPRAPRLLGRYRMRGDRLRCLHGGRRARPPRGGGRGTRIFLFLYYFFQFVKNICFKLFFANMLSCRQFI